MKHAKWSMHHAELQYLTIYSWCCSRSILACHHLWGSSKSQSSQSFHSTSAEIQRFAAPSKTLEIKIPTEQPFDLTSQGLTVWLESMSLSGWVRDWRLGIHCSVPRPGGKVFTVFFTTGWSVGFLWFGFSGLEGVGPLALRCKRVVRRVRWRFRHVFEFCLDFTISIPEEIEAPSKIVLKISKDIWHPMWDIIYSMNQMNQMNQKTTTLNHQSLTITSWKRSLAPWPINWGCHTLRVTCLARGIWQT